MGGDPPPDDGAGVGVDDEAGVGHPGPRRDVGEVGDPQLVRSGRGEVPLHQSGCRSAATAGRVVLTCLDLLTPSIPAVRISRATWSRPTS